MTSSHPFSTGRVHRAIGIALVLAAAFAAAWPEAPASAAESIDPVATARAAAVSYRPVPGGSALEILPADNSQLAADSADSVALVLKQKGFQIAADADLEVDVSAALVRTVSQDKGPAPAQGAQQGPVRGDQYSNATKSPAGEPLTRGNLYSSETGALLSPLRPGAHGHVLHLSITVYNRKTGWYVWRGWADRDSEQVSVDSSLEQMIIGLLAHFGESLPESDLPLY